MKELTETLRNKIINAYNAYNKTGRTAFGATTKAPTEQELNAYRKAWGYIVD